MKFKQGDMVKVIGNVKYKGSIGLFRCYYDKTFSFMLNCKMFSPKIDCFVNFGDGRSGFFRDEDIKLVPRKERFFYRLFGLPKTVNRTHKEFMENINPIINGEKEK